MTHSDMADDRTDQPDKTEVIAAISELTGLSWKIEGDEAIAKATEHTADLCESTLRHIEGFGPRIPLDIDIKSIEVEKDTADRDAEEDMAEVRFNPGKITQWLLTKIHDLNAAIRTVKKLTDDNSWYLDTDNGKITTDFPTDGKDSAKPEYFAGQLKGLGIVCDVCQEDNRKKISCDPMQVDDEVEEKVDNLITAKKQLRKLTGVPFDIDRNCDIICEAHSNIVPHTMLKAMAKALQQHLGEEVEFIEPNIKRPWPPSESTEGKLWHRGVRNMDSFTKSKIRVSGDVASNAEAMKTIEQANYYGCNDLYKSIDDARRKRGAGHDVVR